MDSSDFKREHYVFTENEKIIQTRKMAFIYYSSDTMCDE
jgi:hypothetical protein